MDSIMTKEVSRPETFQCPPFTMVKYMAAEGPRCASSKEHPSLQIEHPTHLQFLRSKHSIDFLQQD